VRELLKRELWEMDIDPDAPNAEADVERKRGMARASLGLYTTQADLEALVAAIRDLVERRDEILELYEPIGSNGYRHKSFEPPAVDIFNPERLLENFLSEPMQNTAG
jgi:hypothetical protein